MCLHGLNAYSQTAENWIERTEDVQRKRCSGKSYYAKQLKKELNAVIISPDEATYDLLNNEQGEFYDTFSKRLSEYLTKKVGEIAQAGATVIFERGLWSKKERQEVREYYKNLGIEGRNI